MPRQQIRVNGRAVRPVRVPTSGGGTPAAPGAPTLSASAASSSSVTLAFSAGTGGAPASYTLQRSASGAGTWSTVATPTSSPATDAGLSASTAYDYRLSATNAGGTSGYSATATATTSAPSGSAFAVASLTNFGGTPLVSPEVRFAHALGAGDVPAGSRLRVELDDGTAVPHTAARLSTRLDGSACLVDVLAKIPATVAGSSSVNLNLKAESGAASTALPNGKSVADVVADLLANHDPVGMTLTGLVNSAGSAEGSGTWKADSSTASGLATTHGGYRAVATGPTACDLICWMNLRDAAGGAEHANLWAQFYLTAFLDAATGAVTKVCWRAWLNQGKRAVANDKYRFQLALTLGAATVRSWGGTASDGRTFAVAPSAVSTTTTSVALPGHQFVNGSLVRVSSTGTLPAPLTAATDYWVQVQPDGTVGFCNNQASAGTGGSIFQLSTQGTGTHTVQGYVHSLRYQRLCLAGPDGLWDWHAGTSGALAAPPTWHVVHDAAYVRRSRMAPPLDLAVTLAHPTQAAPQRHAPGTFADMNPAFSTGGANANYGAPFNEAQARAYRNRADRAGYVQTARVAALLHGSIPFHLADETNFRIPVLTTGTHAGLVTRSSTYIDRGYAVHSADVPTPLGDTNSFTTYDQTHHPTNVYPCYLWEGGQDLLDLQHSDANVAILQRSPEHANYMTIERGQVAGGVTYWSAVICSEPRQDAWRINLLADAWLMSADGTPEKAYFRVILDDTLAFARYITDTAEPANFRSAGGWAHSEVERNGPAGPDTIGAGTVSTASVECCTSFMQSYFALVAGHLVARYPSADAAAFGAQVARYIDNLWGSAACPAFSNAYNVKIKDAPGYAPGATSSNYSSAADVGLRDDGGDGVFFDADGTATRLVNANVEPFPVPAGVRVYLTDCFDQFPQTFSLPPAEVSPYTWYYCRSIAGTADGSVPTTTSFKLSTSASDAGIIGPVTLPGPTTTLSAGIDSSAGAIALASSLTTPPFISALYGNARLIRIDSELMVVTGGDGTATQSVTRGAYGTTAASHSSGAAVRSLPVSVAIFDLQNVAQPSRTTIYRHGGAAGAARFGYLTMARASSAYLYLAGLLPPTAFASCDAFFQQETAPGTGPGGFTSQDSVMHTAVTSV